MKKSILITGCSTGIGYVCAHALQNEGFHVIASCRKEQDVQRLINEGLTCIKLDLNSPESISSGVKQALELAEGKLYAVFNNGAYGQPGALEDLPTEALQDQFQTNFFGWHQLVREVLPHMRIQGEGRHDRCGSRQRQPVREIRSGAGQARLGKGCAFCAQSGPRGAS